MRCAAASDKIIIILHECQETAPDQSLVLSGVASKSAFRAHELSTRRHISQAARRSMEGIVDRFSLQKQEHGNRVEPCP